MEVKAFPAILIVFLLYSYVLSAISIPASRGFIPTKEDSQAHVILAQDGEASKMEGGHQKWKMGSESTDYKDHGPTQHHHPRSSITEIKDNANFLEVEGEKMEGRVDMESLYDPRTTNMQIESDRKFSEVEKDLQVEDYKGPGSNPRHDPNNPPSG